METNQPRRDRQDRRGPRITMGVTAILLLSGLVHLALFVVGGSSWDGPISIRKPSLFGISGGLTTWSIAWLMSQLKPRKFDRFLADAISICLLVEVAIITIQYWRGVPSHFNHSTPLDAFMELTMLGLILVVTVAIFYWSLRTQHLRTVDPAMALAIRGGMWLLTLSCLLGIATTVFGQMNIALGRPYETWGKAGVLKFPHGVALHAIQVLPIAAWIAHQLNPRHALRAMQSVLLGQVLFLVYAVWQTSNGRSRFEWDAFSGTLFCLAALLVVVPTLAYSISFAEAVMRRLKTLAR